MFCQKNIGKPEVTEKSVNRKENEKHQSFKNGKVKQGHSTNQTSKKNTNQRFIQTGMHNMGQTQDISRTLLIGDSILNGINRKGLSNYVECHSIPGATIDTIIDKLQIYDLKKIAYIRVKPGRIGRRG